MGGASRLLLLLTTPFSALRPRTTTSIFRLARHSLPITSHPITTTSLITPIKASQQLHTQSTTRPNSGDPFTSECYTLFQSLSTAGYSGGYENHPDDAYAYLQLQNSSHEFLRLANASLTFARTHPNLLGSLSRKDIQVVVENGTPFLFKSALDNARRMRSFLDSTGTNVLESDKAQTVDLMKYLLSYASNPTSESNSLYCRDIVQSSVRNLMRELVEISSRVSVSHMSAPAHHGVSGGHGHPPMPLGQNIEMKRGDWICPKCSFMNFARNVKCLECEETRPKRQVTSGEWECPECDFYNYGRNMMCLRCDCKRPGEVSFGTIVKSMPHGDGDSSDANKEKAQEWFSQVSQKLKNASASSGSPVVAEDSPVDRYGVPKGSNSSHVPFKPLPADMFAKKLTTKEDISAKDEPEKPERWFERVVDLENTKSDEDFPEIMPIRKGENRFVISSKKKDRSLTSSMNKSEQSSNTKFVPFVPFPPNYFAKNGKQPSDAPDSPVKSIDETSSGSEFRSGAANNMNYVQNQVNSNLSANFGEPNNANSPQTRRVISGNQNFPTSQTSRSNDSWDGSRNSSWEPPNAEKRATTPPEQQKVSSATSNGWSGKSSLEGSAVKEPTDPLDMSEEAKAERWFRRVAQIKDISELSQIPDEDFPSIMPMRKGVNRFVVSKRKTPLERRLTSPQYRRNLPVMSSSDYPPVKKEND